MRPELAGLQVDAFAVRVLLLRHRTIRCERVRDRSGLNPLQGQICGLAEGTGVYRTIARRCNRAHRGCN
jgi:hypothetical protein